MLVVSLGGSFEGKVEVRSDCGVNSATKLKLKRKSTVVSISNQPRAARGHSFVCVGRGMSKPTTRTTTMVAFHGGRSVSTMKNEAHHERPSCYATRNIKNQFYARPRLLVKYLLHRKTTIRRIKPGM